MDTVAGSSYSETVFLDIQGTRVQCNRLDLTKNSDYFVAMFKDDFAEKNQDVIVLNDVKAEAIKIILKLIYDRETVIAEENILSVLQASCMLQFLEVKKICLEQAKEILRENNCINIWIFAEHLDIKELCCKAKLLALLHFMFIKNSEEQYFLELNLDLILSYLGSVHLQCTNEFYIFEVLYIWFDSTENKTMDTLLKLLHCVNFAALTISEIDYIIDSHYISQFELLRESLKCVKTIKNNDSVLHFKDECIESAKKFLNAKNRNFNGLPCILIDNFEEKRNTKPLLYYDKYKRKRKYNVLGTGATADYFVAYYDSTSKSMKNLFAINVIDKLEGFKTLGYKNFFYVYGGEFQIGQGGWNYDFHVYDIIKEIWTKKRSPHPRRHFESCVCGNKIFIVGGTGPYRVIQKNMFWYDLETEEFSLLETLPVSTLQIKCCEFKNKLFILDLNNRKGHIFNSSTRAWTALKIIDNNGVLPVYSEKVTLFIYKNNIFIKENSLFELSVKDGELIIINIVQMAQFQNSNMSYHVEATLADDMLYTLNKEWTDAKNGLTVSLELFNVITKERSKCFQKEIDDILEIDGETFSCKSLPLAIFSMFHPNLVMKNDVINLW